MTAHRRILLKLSGEVLAGKPGFGIDSEATQRIAREIAEAARTGVSIGVVVGGGNFFRGVKGSDAGPGRVSVDQMGMLGTALNAIALRDHLQGLGQPAAIFSAIPMTPILDGFSLPRVLERLGNQEVVIFAGGTGNPFFSTDSAAALRAAEIGASLLAKATKVDGVYDKDPVRFPGAARYERISYDQVLLDELAVMDAAAVSLCRENDIPVVVFDVTVPGNIQRLVEGETIGTLID
ncbi:MAG: UMP kinase [Acidobacteriia bacterium]|nr:UMP kinase [Terriglobia bacterium]